MIVETVHRVIFTDLQLKAFQRAAEKSEFYRSLWDHYLATNILTLRQKEYVEQLTAAQERAQNMSRKLTKWL